MVRRRPLLWTAVLSVLATIVGIVICLQIDWFPVAASSAAPDIDTLYDVLLIVSVPIFVLVMAVVIFSVVAFKAKPGDLSDGEPIHGNTRLEVIWVTIPFIIVSALAAYGWIVLDDIEAKERQRLGGERDRPAVRVALCLPQRRQGAGEPAGGAPGTPGGLPRQER